MSDYKDIIYEIQDQVATITINRPKVLNSFTPVTLRESQIPTIVLQQGTLP